MHPRQTFGWRFQQMLHDCGLVHDCWTSPPTCFIRNRVVRASFIGDPPDHSSRQATTIQSLPLPGLHSEGQVRLRLNAVLGQSSSTPSTPQTPQSAKIHDTQKIVPSGKVHKSTRDLSVKICHEVVMVPLEAATDTSNHAGDT